MSRSTVSHRRSLRALEAKRDTLIEKRAKADTDLKAVRAELAAKRKQGAK